MSKQFDVVCIGAGAGGYTSAIKASQLGKTVAVVDISQDRIGGVCLNEGCIPTKAIIHSSEMYANMKNYGQLLGIEIKTDKPDMKQINAFSRAVVEKLKQGISYLFKKYKITFIEGKAALDSSSRINVALAGGGQEFLEAKNIILATGTRPKTIAGLEFDGKQIISSSEAVHLDYLPESILIIGAGAIGIEFGSLFNNFGSRVTIVELKKDILPACDEDIRKSLKTIFKKRNILIYNESEIKRVEKQKDSVKVEIGTPKGNINLEVQVVLVAVGRAPNTDFQDLLRIGIETDNAGFIKVDNCMRTTVENIYAVGDITGKIMFAHMAYKQAEIAAGNSCGKNFSPVDLSNVPTIIYSDIQVASVGLTEEEVKNKGLDYITAKQYFKSNGRSVINSLADGFIKAIIDKKTHRFLGVHILGYEASELIHQFVVAKAGGVSADYMADFIYGHPTYSEITKDTCLSLFDIPVNGKRVSE